jgi:WD40 repeat protein/DNA-binding winged helix-turn-helix (wHTH) protein/ABC-type dipeptide/oligopeptide/nickel transport system ATPase component
MATSPHLVYEFGPFRLDLQQRTLLRDGEPVALAPKIWDTLALLIEKRGRILEKDEMLEILWPESFVEESNLSQNIFVLRKLLGDDRNGSAFIQTVPRRGYKFVATVKELEITKPGSDRSTTDYWNRHSPFRALQAFEPEDAWLFFGRGSETADLLARLANFRALAVVGNSGCGKSSLVRAGLIPALQAGRFSYRGSPVNSWRTVVFRPSATPFDYLAEALPKQLASHLSLREQAEFIADCREKLPAGGDSLRNAISALADASTDNFEQQHILMVADQFEEIFTLTTDPRIRQQYIEALLASARMDSPIPVHLVLVLRADFYPHCLVHPALTRCLESNLFNVPRMEQAQLRESVEKRLALASAGAEPGLIDSLLEDAGTQPGNLPLLEHALAQLWEKSHGSPRVLSNQAYSEMGRLRGALGRHADEVYESLGDVALQKLAQRIFLELVHLREGAQDTRRRVSKLELSSLGPADKIESVLVRLVSSRLVSTGRESSETFVEVSHEALIREWPALRSWLEENREELMLERRLCQAAAEWQALNQDTGALLRGSRLAQAEEWLSKHSGPPALLQRFVEASADERAQAIRKEREAQERDLAQQRNAAIAERRSAARFRWLSSVLGVMLLVAVSSAFFAYHLEVLEKSRTLAAESGELLPRDHGQALALAITSWRTASTDQAHLAIAKAFPEMIATMNQGGPVLHVAFSSDGQRILTASKDHAARVWSADQGELLATLQGHSATVEDAEFSPDGTLIVTASDDKTARLWQSDNGRLLFTLRGHTGPVWGAAFSPDGKRVVTASDDKTARIWAVADGRVVATLRGHTSTVGTAKFSPDGRRIITTSWDRTARVWDASDGTLLLTLKHNAEVIDAAFSPDNRRIATAAMDNKARVWDSAEGRLLFTLQHDGPVFDVRYSPDGQLIATASRDRTARVWRSSDGRLLSTLQHDGAVRHTAFTRNGRWVVTASADHTARVWNSSNGMLLGIVEEETGELVDAAISADGTRIVTAGGDHTARLWNTMSAYSSTVLRGHTYVVNHVEFSPDRERLLTVGQDDTVRLWSNPDGMPLATLHGSAHGFRQAHFSPDGRRVITAGEDDTARIWSSSDGRLLGTLEGHTDTIRQAEYSPDGKRIVTASNDQTARIWDAENNRLVAILRGHTDQVVNAAFSADGKQIVTASKDNTARVWNSANGQLLALLKGHTAPVWRAVFSPDGSRIVTASFDHTARVWSASDGRLLATLEGHSDRLSDADFSPDGRLIVTAAWDKTARLWNSADYRWIATLKGHTGNVVTAVFSRDSQRVITASEDQTARIWNSTNGRLVTILDGHTGGIWQAVFSPDGRTLATASRDQTARIWRVLTLSDVEAALAQ